jgi:hypothetical protein
MKGVLIGSDFLKLEDGIKLLEINTDTDLFTSDIEFLELTPLFDYLVENSLTKLVLIYKEIHVVEPVVDVFRGACNQYSITFNTIVIPNNSITIPSTPSDEDTFYLRCAYDVTAIIDDTYCRDKSEMVKLMFDTNNHSLLPKTYVVNPNDNITYDTLTSVDNNGNHPNVIVKKILPDFEKTKYPAFYKVDSEVELDSMKQSLNNATLMQEYKFNENNLDNDRICDVIRTWSILLEDVETTIYMGGHLVTNPIPLNIDTITYTGNLLDNKFRFMYFSNPNVLASGVPGHYEVIKIEDGLEIPTTLDLIQQGDVIKSVKLEGLDPDETQPYKETWSSTLDLESLMEYTTASIIKKTTRPYEGWLCKIEYSVGEETSSSILTKTEILLIKDSTSTFKFKNVSEITTDDMLVISNNVTANIVSLEDYYYSGNVVILNIEPDDVFIAGTDLNEINVNSIGSLIVHNTKSAW